MKERFKAKEWEMVTALPFHVFGAVAGADGSIDEDEVQEFLGRMAQAVAYKDALHREVMMELIQLDLPGHGEALKRGLGLDPKKVRKLLKKRLSESEYQSFMGSLFIDAAKIAGISDVSGVEGKLLIGIAGFYGIDMGVLQRTFA